MKIIQPLTYIILSLSLHNSIANEDFKEQKIINDIINPKDHEIIEPLKDSYFEEIKKNMTSKVMLRGSNKTTAQNIKIEARIHEKVIFGNLEIYPRACWKAPIDEKPENKVLLEIYERKENEGLKNIFHGWMFARRPSLSTLEHPLYDISLLECIK